MEDGGKSKWVVGVGSPKSGGKESEVRCQIIRFFFDNFRNYA